MYVEKKRTINIVVFKDHHQIPVTIRKSKLPGK